MEDVGLDMIEEDRIALQIGVATSRPWGYNRSISILYIVRAGYVKCTATGPVGQ